MPPRRTRQPRLPLLFAAVAGLLACQGETARDTDSPAPADAANELLAADRAFSDSGAGEDVVSSLSRIFDDSVRLIAMGRSVRGREAALELLRSVSANLTARATWAPIRVALSADGTHGFTAGYQEIRFPNDSVARAKYIAYWTRTKQGWRVMVYKRGPRPDGATTADMLPPLLPERLTPPSSSAEQVAAYRASLAAAEASFSEAGQAGLGAAFRAFGAPEAMHMGAPTDTNFRLGPEAIAEGVEAGGPVQGTLTWGADETIVAPSGDFGINIGTIVVTPTSGEARRIPFFTIWRRARLTDPWRYVAE
ncbi:MAG TPA: DUF4440 domain-containing protein [Gemmatimonadaceae bacterium]|nr:DUF4440 domain-containing protein [Gemmatimonadaceae bacterium]